MDIIKSHIVKLKDGKIKRYQMKNMNEANEIVTFCENNGILCHIDEFFEALKSLL